MTTDIVSLKRDWCRRFGRVFDEDYREVKIIQSPDGRGFFRAVYSQKLEEWYMSPKGRARYSQPKCFLCSEYDQDHKINEVVLIEHLKIMFNLKFVMRNHWLIAPIKHRSQPTAADIVVLQQLATASGLSVFGNLRDAGASYPKHVHYQTLETEFPAVSRPGRLIYDDDGVQVERLNYPVLAFRFSPQSNWTKQAIKRLGKIIATQPGAGNPLFYGSDIYYLPRVKSIPSNTGGFKFAAAEVYGTIFARTRRLFEEADGQMILASLNDVCLPIESTHADNYQKELVAILQEVR